MAAVVTLLGTATFNTTSGTKTVTATPAVGDLIVIVTAHSGNTSTAAPTDNNSGGGGTYTLINTAVKATSADTMKMWVRDALITSATSTVFTHAPGTTTGGGLAVLKITGMDKTGATAVVRSGIQSNQAAGGTPAPALGATPSSTNPIITAVFNATSPAGVTARTGYTRSVNLGYATPTTGLAVAHDDAGETSATITWGSTSASAFASIAVELNALVTHATTGALTGPGSAVTGSANHSALHTTTGGIVGPGSTITGSATNFTPHATSGDIVGPGSAIVGAADRQAAVIPHTTTGDIVGPGSVVDGAASRFRAFATSGILVGQGAIVTGDADHEALVIPHTTTGALTGQGSEVVGAASRFRAFDTSGALPGQSAIIVGDAARFHAFATSGDLIGAGSEITGDADHESSIVAHVAAGDIIGPGAEIFGQAEKTHYFDTSGDLIGPGALLDGTAYHAPLYPDPADVRAGVQYGPGGMFVGTLTVGAGETIIRLRSFTERF